MNKKYKIFLVVIAVLAGFYGVYFWQFEYRGNVHAITPGQAYRSGQLGPERLADVIAEFGIKSVLNLRGETPGESWYDDEVRVCSEKGVAHFDVGIQARFEPAQEKIDQILDVFEKAPRPILIHCRAGADRAGLASAMWKVVIDGEDKEKAGEQLSILYGHLPFGQTTAMDTFFANWTPPAKKMLEKKDRLNIAK